LDSLEFAVVIGTKQARSVLQNHAGKRDSRVGVQNKEPVFSNDVSNDKRFDETVSREIQYPVDIIVAVPLMLREECPR
jgi:hypothetical protein